MKQLIEKEKYLSKVIRELKIPTVAQINALKTILKTTKQKFSPDETELIELTLYSCNYMHKLIDVFSRLLAPKIEKISLTYSRFDMVELQNEVMNELKILLKYANLKTEVICEKEIIIGADRAKLKNVIESILSCVIKNAYKNTTIQIKIEKKENKIQYLVKSNSTIEENILCEIFNKAKTDNTLLKHSGAQLSLYLSKEIINAHFGNMIVEQCDNNTNILGFCLPV